jgi:hypothetical protein
MAELKHVGRLKSSGRKCLVVFRTLPNDAFNCLVILTENLHPAYHDALINLVESSSGQSAYEFADVLNRSMFSDGSKMLQSLYLQGLMTKVPTDQVEMIPNAFSSIMLADLNQLIAESKGVSVQDLAIKDNIKEVASASTIPEQRDTKAPAEPQAPAPLSDDDLAKKYRSDADRLDKEAAALRKLADDLIPVKKLAEKPVPEAEESAPVKKPKTPSTARSAARKSANESKNSAS